VLLVVVSVSTVELVGKTEGGIALVGQSESEAASVTRSETVGLSLPCDRGLRHA
jgi:hypothetical protein